MPVGFDSIRAGASGGADAYEIDYACRFNDNDSPYLTRTPSAGNRKTWTYSFWLKRGNLGVGQQVLFMMGANFNNATYFEFNSDNTMDFLHLDGGYETDWVKATQLFRDPASWSHLVVSVDTTQGTAANRVKLYHNGVQITDLTISNYPSQNFNTDFNAAVAHKIGSRADGVRNFDGYFSEIVHIEGQQLEPTSFGEFSSTTGQWVPIDPSGLTFGTNGFHLDFADASDLGNDVSGNNNDWTSSGLATNDQVTDTPTNNVCTLSSIDNSGATLSNGNLKSSWGSGSWRGVRATFVVPKTGKWKWEATLHDTTYFLFALATLKNAITVIPTTSGSNSYILQGDGNINYSSSNQTDYGTPAVNDIVEFRVNDGIVSIYVNNVLAHTFSQDMNSVDDVFSPGIWHNEHAGGMTYNFGQTAFTYNPTDYLALNTTNLPDPAIPDPSAHFQTTLYTGNATAGRAITQDGNSTFGPDMVWIKNRDQADEWKALDTTRGATKELNLDSTNAESTDANGLTAFSGTDGFTLGTGAGGYNDNSEDFVAYQWEKGVTPGFGIVAYTGNGSTQEISHGLGVLPDFLFVKSLDETRHITPFHSALGATHYGEIDRNVPFGTGNANLRWGNNSITVEPTSSVFTIGNSIDVNENTKDYIAYLFAAVEGFSAFGGYTGNGSTNGPFINLGFKPALVITKYTGGVSWWVTSDHKRSPTNEIDLPLSLEGAGDEANFVSSMRIDFLSNGFKLRETDGYVNGNGSSYIYMAWAETPFKTATAR